ncbi:hypothetical protein LLG39_08895 [bacterium]|nr:hypothetical protein [bacterium]
MREYGMNPLSPVETCDPYWKDTVLCINASGAQGNIVVTDSKGSVNTRVGTPKIITDFGYPAVDFNGSGDYYSIINNTSLVLGTGDFTIEVVLRGTTFANISGANRTPLAKGANTSSGWGLLFLEDGRVAWYDTVTRFEFTLAVAVATLTHLCVTRKNGIFYAFVGGASAGTFTLSLNLSSTAPILFGSSLTTTGWFMGHIPAVRITKAARWTTPFTPPKFPFPTA